MADGYYLTDADREKISDMVALQMGTRFGRRSPNYYGDPVMPAGSVYAVKTADVVPAASGAAPGESECEVYKWDAGTLTVVEIGGTPKTLTAYNIYEVELPEGFHIIVTTKYGRWLFVHSGLDDTTVTPPPGSGSGSAKQAIVMVESLAGVEYRGWFCTEEPVPTFRMDITAPIEGWNMAKTRAQVELQVPGIFYQSVFASTIQATGVMCQGGPAMATAAYNGTVQVQVARVPLLAPRPTSVVVQVKGTRSDTYAPGAQPPQNWQQHTLEEYLANNDFWRMAKPK